jgi:ABC-2 type transport system ATP-binding protein
MMKVIEIKGLTKKFGSFTALDNIDLTVNEGEVYGFIGPNGAGKSTTIRILLGMLKATTGEAKVFGEDAWHDAVDIHKRVAYIPGEVQIWPNLTGGEVIDLFIKMSGTLDNSKKEALLKKFDFDPRKKCRTYSKGNRQKIALISAFATDADLFILDEPTSGLDPLMEKVFQDCIKELKVLGKTVFLSSHILSEVEKLCDKVAIIKNGKIIETGSLTELRYLTRTKLIIQTNKPVIDLQNLKGVSDIQVENGNTSFYVDHGTMDKVMEYVSQYGIIKLESTPPTLEDLFLRHYDGKSGGTK